MTQLDCSGDCYTDLSFMGVAYDPNCDMNLCRYLSESGENDCTDDSCCVDVCCC